MVEFLECLIRRLPYSYSVIWWSIHGKHGWSIHVKPDLTNHIILSSNLAFNLNSIFSDVVLIVRVVILYRMLFCIRCDYSLFRVLFSQPSDYSRKFWISLVKKIYLVRYSQWLWYQSVTPPDHGYGGNIRGLGDVIQVSQHIHI